MSPLDPLLPDPDKPAYKGGSWYAIYSSCLGAKLISLEFGFARLRIVQSIYAINSANKKELNLPSMSLVSAARSEEGAPVP